MNGGSPRTATLKPLTRPMKAPIRMPPSTPTTSGSPALVNSSPVITEESVMPVPIDRSMPPVMITKVVPTARIPMTAVDSRIELMLLTVKKFGLTIAKKATSAMSVPKASICCTPWPSRARSSAPREVVLCSSCSSGDVAPAVTVRVDAVMLRLPRR